MRTEVIRLKALMPGISCRKLAATFCLLHEHRRAMTVGRTFVNDVIRTAKHEIVQKRKEIRRRKPRRLPKNLIWALDLTDLRCGRPVLGVLDHGTRACVALRALPTKASIQVVRALCDAVERFGAPKTLRTDNEAVFTARLFRWSLWILGIRHQRIERCAPWQNGRVERFFGTLKASWRQLVELDEAPITQADLDVFRGWYNHVRPHENLAGLTPALAWSGRRRRVRREPRFFEAWHGVLCGYWFPS